MRLRNWKVQDKKFKSFLKQTSEIFSKEWEGEILIKWFFIYKQLEKCQNKYYPDNLSLIRFCRRTSLHVLMFPVSLLKKNLWSNWKWQTFVWCQKIKIFFMTHLFLTFVNKEIFFQEYVGMELKIIFIIFEVFFEWQKQNITVVTFKQASITCR